MAHGGYGAAPAPEQPTNTRPHLTMVLTLITIFSSGWSVYQTIANHYAQIQERRSKARQEAENRIREKWLKYVDRLDAATKDAAPIVARMDPQEANHIWNRKAALEIEQTELQEDIQREANTYKTPNGTTFAWTLESFRKASPPPYLDQIFAMLRVKYAGLRSSSRPTDLERLFKFAAAIEQESIVVRTNISVNIRSAPQSDAPVIAPVAANTECRIATIKDDGSWIKVELVSGGVRRLGWVYSPYIDVKTSRLLRAIGT